MSKTVIKKRCPWANGNTLYERYHDDEWGVPLHVDTELFGYLILEGAQAGLSWQILLNKRENYRRLFADFDSHKVADFTEGYIEELRRDQGIVRNRLKIHSAVTNAQKFIEVQKEFGSFDTYLWQFVGGKSIQNSWRTLPEVPVDSPEAIALSKDLIHRGFKFVGPKIVYAYMQATGMVNDHLVTCFRHKEVRQLT